MVGFTRTTRRLIPVELTRLIDRFQSVATEVVGGQHGRVVKTVGDEVLFVTEQPVHGAEIALQLIERLAEIDTLPELRVGLAVGQVVSRFGDVYGEVVNIAARLTTHAKPGRILVDRNWSGGDQHQVGPPQRCPAAHDQVQAGVHHEAVLRCARHHDGVSSGHCEHPRDHAVVGLVQGVDGRDLRQRDAAESFDGIGALCVPRTVLWHGATPSFEAWRLST
ncbi:MAG: adenylate/guanylate cyclase domain-containing protein [Actinomycetota bacterium]|nr:adenylate/guanylate cyclase domain-containing protein [Actinomycetota bacterium]